MNRDPRSEKDHIVDENKESKSETGSPHYSHHPSAGRDKNQIKKNQERLGVGADHKTPDMKKHRRGTFP